VELQVKKLLSTVVGEFQNLSDIIIQSSLGDYRINFHSFDTRKFNGAYFLIDQNLKECLEVDLARSIFLVAEESYKTLGYVEDVMIKLSQKGMTKNNCLIVIGGGYLQDVGTLVAALYMRGVEWIYVPTTLAAMGDSCIGGKSSINAGSTKNLVGNFYPPKEVLIDTTFLTTLPKLEIVAGISEIIKISFARSPETFSECFQLLSKWKADASRQTVTEIVQLSLRSKQHFVQLDEFDLGIRKLLNFGHSFGHALESASDYKIPHGVAVMLGMIAATQHPLSKESNETQILVETSLTYIREISHEIIDEISNIDYEKFSLSLAKDKKNTNMDLVLVLPKTKGLELVNIPFAQGALLTATGAMKSGIEMVLNEIR